MWRDLWDRLIEHMFWDMYEPFPDLFPPAPPARRAWEATSAPLTASTLPRARLSIEN